MQKKIQVVHKSSQEKVNIVIMYARKTTPYSTIATTLVVRAVLKASETD